MGGLQIEGDRLVAGWGWEAHAMAWERGRQGEGRRGIIGGALLLPLTHRRKGVGEGRMNDIP